MFKIFDKDIKLTVFALGLFFYMCIENDLCFTFLFPNSLRYIWGLIIPLVCGYCFKENKYKTIGVCTTIYFLYYTFLHFSLWSFLDSLAVVIMVISVVSLKPEKRITLLDLLKSYLTIIVTISLAAWVMVRLGVNLPYENIEINDFHNNVNNYYFFSTNPLADEINLFPRFSGMFLEAGQLATPCVLFIFSDGGAFKDKRNIILLIAVILSFSLVAYAMLAIGYSIRGIIINRKNLLIKVFIPVVILLSVGYVMFQAANDDNPIYAMILSRLEADDENGFVGNNRTGEYVDYRFEKLMQSSDKWFGISSEFARTKDDWTSSASGYKKYIIHNGLVGFLLLWLMVFSVFKVNKSRYNYLFLFLVFLAFMPRSMLSKTMWLFPVVLGFFVNNKIVNLFYSRISGQK